jgi:hypothetical protein
VPESVEGFAELQKLRHDVEDLKAITGAILHAQPDLGDRIMAVLRKDEVMARVLLLVDGVKTQGEIVEALAAEKLKGGEKSGVSRRFETLSKDLGLIAFDRQTKAGKVYRRTALESALKITRRLEKERKSLR